jgi:TP901 family phage tail tape measure protein/lambda family phage tail tape measure protein
MAMGQSVGNVIAQLKLNSAQFERGYKRALGGFTKGISGMVRFTERSMKRLAIAMTAYATVSVKAFSTFEDAMVRSSAVTTGAVGKMREEMEKSALAMSKRTILSARELAEGYFALGQAGFTAAQAIKALPVVTDFAIASQVKLDTATRYLVRTLEGLGMASADPIKNMEQMERVSNAFTFAAIKTTAEIRDFAVAMTHAAAPALRLVNKSMEEGTSVLMAFARAGIVGEEAGTLLWTTVRDLQRASIKARGEWKKLGLDIYDSEGRMRNMAEIFGDLEKRFANMSDEGKKVSLMLLGFQDRSLRGIQALMGFSDQMREFEKEMGGLTKLTRDLSEKYMVSFRSQVKMLWHQITDVSIAVGKKLAPVLRELAKDFERNQEKIKKFAEAVAEYMANAIGYLRDFANYMMTDWRSALGASLAIAKELFVAFGKSVLYTMEETFRVLLVNIVPIMKRVRGKTRELEKMVSQELFRRFTPFQLADLKSTYPKQYDILLEQVEKQMKEKMATAEFEKKFNEKYPLQPFTLDTKKFTQLAADTEIEIRKVLKDWGFNEFMQKEESLKAWRTIKGVVEDNLVVPLVTTFKWAKGEVREFFEKTNWADKQLSHAGRVEVLMQKLAKPLNEVNRGLKTQKDMIGLTREEMEKYNLGLELARIMEQEFGETMDWVAEERAKYNEVLEEQTKLLDAVNEKNKEFSSLFTGMRQWTEDASYLWKNLGEDMSRALDGFADTLADWMSGAETDWKAFTASILRDWLRTILKMQMASLLKGILPTPGDGGLFETLFGGAKPGAGTAGVKSFPGVQGPSIGAALGRAFSRGNLIPMQYGGILGQPALLPMQNKRTALVAEKGPEAVMPLGRDKQGRLGVYSQEQSAPVVNTKIVNVYDQEEALAALGTTRGERVILNVLRKNGVI